MIRPGNLSHYSAMLVIMNTSQPKNEDIVSEGVPPRLDDTRVLLGEREMRHLEIREEIMTELGQTPLREAMNLTTPEIIGAASLFGTQ